MTITAIGFANKYYTLWQITEEKRPLGNGHNYVVTHYNYIKNISLDKEIALSKYPNAILDENLRGKTISWKTEKEVWDNVDAFRFGKYKYYKIADCTDTNYIAWYWDQIYDEHKDFVSKVLQKRGYEVRTSNYTSYDGMENTTTYLMGPEDLENEALNNEAFDNMMKQLVKNETLEIIPERNLDEFGEIRINDVIYHFDFWKENFYNGYIYGLPLDKKGNAKRIKNKKLNITKYTYTCNGKIITINVEEFAIVK